MSWVSEMYFLCYTRNVQMSLTAKGFASFSANACWWKAFRMQSASFIFNCPLTHGLHILQEDIWIEKITFTFCLCVVKTLSSRGPERWAEDRQLIDQTASLLLIYSDRKSINSFSLISPPLLSHRSSLSEPHSLHSLISLLSFRLLLWLTYANRGGVNVKGSPTLRYTQC